MFKFLIVAVLFATVAAFMPVNRMIARKTELSMNLQDKIAKALGVAAIGFAMTGPIVVNADGAVSKSTVYRARNNYGAKILDLGSAVESGNFAALSSPKVKNAFDLFVSSSNALGGAKYKALKEEEAKIEGEFLSAVSAKDSAKTKSAYAAFVKAADLKSLYKPEEVGQTDSSGYSPTWGTSRQQIYIR